jgi:hypothetical protein
MGWGEPDFDHFGTRTHRLGREGIGGSHFAGRKGVVLYFLSTTFEWAGSQKDRSFRLQQILEEKKQKAGISITRGERLVVFR